MLAIAFFTPPDSVILRNETKYIDVAVGEDGAAAGSAYIFGCPYSSLCRQVVTDEQGRVAHFDFAGNEARVQVKVGERKAVFFDLQYV